MRLTLTLVLINVLVYFFVLPNLPYYVENYGFRPSSFLGENYKLIVTSTFLHAGLGHLAFNMIALFFLGSSLEKKVGPEKYLFVYFLGGIGANLAMLIPFFFHPESVGVGASGAISALIGLGTFLCPGKLVLFPFVLPIPFVVAGALYFLTTTLNLFVPSQIAYPVHLMGMLLGAGFGLAWSKEKGKRIFIFLVSLLLIVSIPYLLRAIL